MKAIEWVHYEKGRILRTFDPREFACGWGAAFVNITVTYPIYKMIFRQMLHGSSLRSAFQQIRGEGWFYLYRGMLPVTFTQIYFNLFFIYLNLLLVPFQPLAQRTVSLSLMFGVYDGTKKPLIHDFGWNPYTAKVVAGLTAGQLSSSAARKNLESRLKFIEAC